VKRVETENGLSNPTLNITAAVIFSEAVCVNEWEEKSARIAHDRTFTGRVFSLLRGRIPLRPSRGRAGE